MPFTALSPLTHTLSFIYRFLTSRIPRVPYAQEGYEYHYLPKLTVRNFMEHYWRESARVPFEQDPEYVRMMDLIERRERIPLLELVRSSFFFSSFFSLVKLCFTALRLCRTCVLCVYVCLLC